MTTERKMTPKGFLHKTTTRAALSAASFLQAHRDFLTTGELADVTSPILQRVDDGSLMPTPGLQEIAAAVMGHIIARDIQKLDDKINNPPEAAKPKPWTSSVYDVNDVIQTRTKDNGEFEDLVKGFDDASSADRWSDRMLFDGTAGWYAIIEGHGTMVRVERDEAIARILKKPRGPSVHQKAMTTRSLGFGVRAKQDRSSFSRG